MNQNRQFKITEQQIVGLINHMREGVFKYVQPLNIVEPVINVLNTLEEIKPEITDGEQS